MSNPEPNPAPTNTHGWTPPSKDTPDTPPVDERTLAGAIITNGQRLWEIQGPVADGWLAINLGTGYPITLTMDTIKGCRMVLPEPDLGKL